MALTEGGGDAGLAAHMIGAHAGRYDRDRAMWARDLDQVSSVPTAAEWAMHAMGVAGDLGRLEDARSTIAKASKSGNPAAGALFSLLTGPTSKLTLNGVLSQRNTFFMFSLYWAKAGATPKKLARDAPKVVNRVLENCKNMAWTQRTPPSTTSSPSSP